MNLCNGAIFLFRRSRLFLMIVICGILAEAKKAGLRRHHHNNRSQLLFYFAIGVTAVVGFIVVGYCAKEFCPRGPVFTPLELDEIRLDHLDDIESSLQKNINVLKDKLAFHRKKKTQVQTDRDIKRRLGERVEMFHDKGRSIYGEAWDEGDIPVKAVVAMTTKEVEELRRDAEHIAEQRKQEEKEDLWKLWNDMRQDGGGGGGKGAGAVGIGGIPGKGGPPGAYFKDNQALLARDNNSSHDSHSYNDHSRRSVSVTNNHVKVKVNHYSNTLNGQRNTVKQQHQRNNSNSYNSNNFELGGNGKFTSPTKEDRPNTYTYNNNTYNYADNDNSEQRQSLLSPKVSSPAGSTLRLQPPILDLSKLTTAPAHIKPPPNKPPSQPKAQYQQPQQQPPQQHSHNPLSAQASFSAGNGHNNNNNNNLNHRDSMRPSMRSYAPGKRPPPPAGPKPSSSAPTSGSINPVRPPSHPNPDRTNMHIHSSINSSSSEVEGGGGATVGTSMGPPGIRSMKRPPPPMMAPPGYVPGNSSRGRGGIGAGSGSGKSDVHFNNDDKEH